MLNFRLFLEAEENIQVLFATFLQNKTEVLFNELYERLKRITFRAVKNKIPQLDITDFYSAFHDYIIKIQQNPEEFTHVKDVINFSITAVHRLLLNIYRNKKSRAKLGKPFTDFSSEIEPEYTDNEEESELTNAYQQALAQLTELEREVAILKHQGLRHEEIAQKLGISISKSKHVYSRAIDKLTELLKSFRQV